MSEMVERVARAIYEAMTGADFIGAGAGPDHDLAFEHARVAITAMREPSEAMVEACNRAAFAQGGGAIVLRPVWQAMIDAALKDPPSS